MDGVEAGEPSNASMSLHNCSQSAGTSPFQVAFAPNTLTFTANPKKRRFDENLGETMKENKGSVAPVRVCPPRRFLAVPGGQGVFHTEEWRERQTPMYLPVTDNLLINTANIEQLSFTAGSWFLADETGNYCGSQEGSIINLWRYDEKERKLYISRSLLFIDEQIYNTVRKQLEEL